MNIFWKRKETLTIVKKVAVALYYFASCGEYRLIGNQFGVHKTTVSKIVHQFVNVMSSHVIKDVIKFPDQMEALQCAKLFEEKCHLPNIIGAIDGTHIPILPPGDGYRDYINRKGWASFILQAVVGPTYQFLEISIKQPGSSHDAAALLVSSLYKNIDKIMPKVCTYY